MRRLIVIIAFMMACGFTLSCESTSADDSTDIIAIETTDDTVIPEDNSDYTDSSDSSVTKMTEKEQQDFFKTYVALGDSLTHGCQSLNVEENRQYYSWPAQLARAMETEFNQPLIEYPGIGMPNIEDAFKNGWFDTWASTMSYFIKCMLYWYRVDRYDNQANLNNFAMAGATVDDVVSYDGTKKITYIADTFLMSLVGMMNPWIMSVVGLNPATSKPALDQALDRDPTFLTIWIGSNDTIFATIMGDDGAVFMTEVDTWKEYWDILVAKIKAKESIKGVLVLNLPDNTEIPFLQPINNKYHTVSEGSDIPEGSMVPFFATRSSKISEVITPDQLEAIRDRIIAINKIIKATCEAENWAMMDTYSILKRDLPGGIRLIKADGTLSDIVVTADYATGGFFSLDGIHPSSTGYARVANEAVKLINSHYGTNLPCIDEVAVWENDSTSQDPIDPRDYPAQMGNMSYLFNVFCRIMAQLL